MRPLRALIAISAAFSLMALVRVGGQQPNPTILEIQQAATAIEQADGYTCEFTLAAVLHTIVIDVDPDTIPDAG